MNKFIIEQDGKLYDDIKFFDPVLESKLKNSSYNDLLNNPDIFDIMCSIRNTIQEATNNYSDIVVTLVNEENIFLWSILMSATGSVKICNWISSDKKYKYEN